MADSNDYKFEVFISYATNPDYSLARNIESFLETFNKLPTPEHLTLTPLRICVDGSDFQTAKKSGDGKVESTIDAYLSKSKELLVLCSRNARKSPWVDQEIRWFLANRGPDAIRLALTEGEDLSKLNEVFPQAIIDAGLHERIAYDFRGVHKRARQNWQAVRDFDDERTRLAAALYGKSAGEIQPIWFREQQRLAHKRTRIFIIVTVVLLALLAGTIYFYFVADTQRKRALAESERTRRQFYVASMIFAQRALNDGSVPLARQLLAAQQPSEGREDLRDFDWSYLWRRANAEKSQLFAKDVAFEKVSVSFDGSLVAAGGRPWTFDKTSNDDPSFSVYVWSLQGKELKYVLKGHGAVITAVKFSPTAPVLASGSENGILKIWNAESGTEMRSVAMAAVYALAYSPDGSMLAVADGAYINLFNTTTWERTGRVAVYLEQTPVEAIAFSPDGHVLAVGGWSKKVSLWDVAKRKLIQVLGEHADGVFSVAWSAQSNLLATGGRDGVVILWDMNKKKALTYLRPSDDADSLAFTRDGKLLAVGTGDRLEPDSGKTVELWDVATASRRGLLKGHPRRIDSLEFTPSGDSLISVGEEETIRVWDVQTSSFMTYFRGHSLPVWALDYSPDGKLMASGDGAGSIKLRTLESGTSVELKGHEERVVDLSFDPANRLLASVGWDGTLRLWQLASQPESQVLLTAGLQMTAVKFAPDGKLAATNCDGNIYLWDGPDFKSRPGLKQTGCPTFLAWSPDSQHFVTGGGDPVNKDSPKSVFLWRVGAPDPVKVLEGHSSWPADAAFSPDGKYLVTGSWDGEVIVWDLASGTVRHTMRGHTDSVTAVAFSPSGKIIASAGTDATLRFWDTVTGQERGVFTDNKQQFYAMRFHPSGQILAAGGFDGLLVQWIGDKSPLTQARN